MGVENPAIFISNTESKLISMALKWWRPPAMFSGAPRTTFCSQWLCQAQKMAFHTHSYHLLVLFTVSSTVFLGLRGDATKTLFRAELSTITYSQHLVKPKVSAIFTVVRWRKSFWWWRLQVMIVYGHKLIFRKRFDTKSIYLNDSMELSLPPRPLTSLIMDLWAG